MTNYFGMRDEHPNCLPHEPGAWDENLHTLQPVRDSHIIRLDDRGFDEPFLAYYTNSGPTASVGLAISSDLTFWRKHHANPLLKGEAERDYRWPSPCLTADGSIAIFLSETVEGRLERWDSEDGQSFTHREIIATGTTYYNPYVWQDPVDGQWCLYTHEGSKDDSTIACRQAGSVAGLSDVSPTTVLETPDGWHTLASPSVMYADGRYWLAVEYKLPAPRVIHKLSAYPAIRRVLEGVGAGGVWKTALFVSDDPVEGFTMTTDSPVLTGACAMHLLGPNGERLYLYYNDQQPRWHQHVRLLEY